MERKRFNRPISRSFILLFWLIVGAIFLGIYLFDPSLLNRMRQSTYQNTPYVNTPLSPS